MTTEPRNPITEIIAVESAKLREKWVTFQNSCPKDERLDTAKSEPTIEGVVDMVKEVNRAWEARRKSGRRGRVMALFHKFCGTLDAHSSMLEVLPEGSEYVSLFTGTLNAVIRVCRIPVLFLVECLTEYPPCARRQASTTSE